MYDKMKNGLLALSLGELNKLTSYIEENFPEVTEAKWTQAYINSLPDSCFLLVRKPVKDKARDRALPVKDKNGKVDIPHLRNALARINQVKGFPPAAIATAKRKLQTMAKQHLKMSKGKDMMGEAREMESKECKFDMSKMEDKMSQMCDEMMKTMEDMMKQMCDKMEKMMKPSGGDKESIESLEQEVETPQGEAEVVEEIVEQLGANEDEREAVREFLVRQDPETLQDIVSTISKDGGSEPVQVETIEDPTASFEEEKVATEKGQPDQREAERAAKVRELVSLVKKGDRNAQRILNGLLEEMSQGLSIKQGK